MWDEALREAQLEGEQALICDVDYVDSSSKAFRDSILANSAVQSFLSERFVLGLDDFSIDPPATVGFDSLRNLGLRLSGLEDRYRIVVHPTVIILRPDSSEVDRITLPNKLTPKRFIDRVREILEGRNTLRSHIATFWRDTTSILGRLALVDQFEERSMYDSVVKHLDVLAHNTLNAELARESNLRYSYLRLRIEGKSGALRTLMQTFKHSGQDSILYVTALEDLLDFYKRKKRADSVAAFYNKIFDYTGVRDPDLLNDYAWQLATYTRLWDSALAVIDEALRSKPTEPNYYDTRALVDYSLHRFSDAVQDAERALQYAASEDKKFFQTQLESYKKDLEVSLKPAEVLSQPATKTKIPKPASKKRGSKHKR